MGKKRLTVVKIRKPEDSQSVIGGLIPPKENKKYTRHMFKCRNRAADATALLSKAETYTYLAG